MSCLSEYKCQKSGLGVRPSTFDGIISFSTFEDSFIFHYRPQRSCEGYVFTSVCLSTGGEYLTRYTPLGPGTPPDQVHPPRTRYTPQPGTPPGPGPPPGPGTNPQTRYAPQTRCTPPTRNTPQTRYPLDQVHPPGTRYTPQDKVHPPGPGTPSQTRYTLPPPGPGTPLPPRYSHCCGRYASYWNAFLFDFFSQNTGGYSALLLLLCPIVNNVTFRSMVPCLWYFSTYLALRIDILFLIISQI